MVNKKIKGFMVEVIDLDELKDYWVYSITDKTVSLLDDDRGLLKFSLKDGKGVGSNKGSYIPSDVMVWVQDKFFSNFNLGMRYKDVISLPKEELDSLLKENIVCKIEHKDGSKELEPYVIQV